MHVGVLGPLLVLRGGRDVTPRGRRPRDLLTVLLQRRGTFVPPEVLLDLVWDDRAHDLSVAAVHTVVARLRRSIGADAVQTHDSGYRLAPETTTDAQTFADLVRRAREAGAAGRAAESVAGYREALALWRGEVAFDGSRDDLVIGARTRLTELRTAAAEDLAAALLALGDAAHDDEALQVSTTLIAEQPLRERPYALAMLAAYRSGRQAQALKIFRDLRTRLRDELGVDPGPDAAALHTRILAQDPSLAARSTPADRPPARVTVRGAALPVPPTPTIGRDADIEEVLAHLSRGRRLVTIVGPGGVGKSRLLAEVGRRLVDGGAPEIGYLDLSGVDDVEVTELAEAAALAYGIPSSGDPVDAICGFLGRRDVVVLVDEAEWALDGVAALAEALLSRCPALRLVVTSRVALDIVGERRLELGPLPVPAEGSGPDEARTSPALRLLSELIADRAPGLVVSPADLASLGEICRRVDGLPLALELLAGHAPVATVGDLVALTDDPLELATAGRGRSPRQRTLRDALQWSVDRLDAEQRQVFCRLGVFAGPFDLEAVRAVAGPGDLDAAVRGLVRAALVQPERRGGSLRLRLLRTVRDLALEGLSESGETAAIRRRHREWYAVRWRGAGLSDDLIADVHASYDDYLEALRDALAAGDAAAMSDLAVTLSRLWQFTASPRLGHRWTLAALESRRLSGWDRARVLSSHAGFQLELSVTAARAALAEAIPILTAVQDHATLVQALLGAGIERYVTGDFVQAAEDAERAVGVARDHAPGELADALAVLAAFRVAIGKRDEALAAADESWAMVRAGVSVTELVAVALKLSLALTESGHPARALEMVERALERLRTTLGVPPAESLLINAGWAALACGDHARSLYWFAEAVSSGVAGTFGTAEALSGAGVALTELARAESAATENSPPGSTGAEANSDRLERTREAAAVVAGSAHLCRTHGLTLTPWQQSQVRAYRASAESEHFTDSSGSAVAPGVASAITVPGEPAAGCGPESGALKPSFGHLGPLPEDVELLAVRLTEMVRSRAVALRPDPIRA